MLLKEYLYFSKKMVIDDTLFLHFTDEEAKLLEEFSFEILDKKHYETVWAFILDAVAEKYYITQPFNFLTNLTLENLVLNKKNINDLSHLFLDNYWLLRIYDVCPKQGTKGLITVYQRAMDATGENLLNFLLKKYANEFVMGYAIIYNSLNLSEERRQRINKINDAIPSQSRYKGFLKDYMNFFNGNIKEEIMRKTLNEWISLRASCFS